MAIQAPTSNSTVNLRGAQLKSDPGLDRDRLRVRAKEILRQRLVLENELGAAQDSEAEREFLQSRIQTLSNDEDRLATQLAQAERQVQAEKQQELERRQRRAVAVQRPSAPQTSAAQAQPLPQEEQLARVQQLQQMAATNQRRRRQREETYDRLAKSAKKAFFLIVIFTLWLAALADILSIVDLGWVVSWALPIATWFIVRRIKKINHSVENIKTAQQQALRDLHIIRQRNQTMLASSGQAALFAQAKSLEITQEVPSYIKTFIRDEVVSQALELVPFLDWLPMYLGEVAKVLIDQHKAYRKAQEVLVPYRQTLDLVNKIEDAEMRYMAARVGINLPQQAPVRQQQQSATSAPNRAPQLAPSY